MTSAKTTIWKFYDGANSIVHLIALTIILPWAFGDQWSSITGRDPIAAIMMNRGGDQAWGFVWVASLAVAGLAAYVIGKFADKTNLRSLFFKLSTVGTILSLVAVIMYFNNWHNHLLITTGLLICLFTISLYLYDVMLIDSTESQDTNRLAETSGSGWAIGYAVSGLVLFAMWAGGLFQTVTQTGVIPKILVIVLLLFGTGCILIIRFWPKDIQLTDSRVSRIHSGNIGWFLLGGFCLSDTIATLTVFVTLISQNTFGLSLELIVWQFLLFHIVAVPATFFLTPYLVRTVSLSNVGMILSGAWITTCVSAALAINAGYSELPIYIVLGMFGLLVGTTPAILRALYAEIIPVEQRGRYFAYAVVTQRTFAFIGPLIATITLSLTSSYPAVLLSILPFLALSLLSFYRLRSYVAA